MARMIGRVAHQRANACGCCPEWHPGNGRERRKSRRAVRRRERQAMRESF